MTVPSKMMRIFGVYHQQRFTEWDVKSSGPFVEVL